MNNDKTKVMFFDIDGTLLVPGIEVIDPKVIEVIQRARENGHKMFINTGRTYANLTDHLLNSCFDGFICALGTYIMIDGEVVFYHHNKDEVCAFIREKAAEYNLDIVYEAHHGIYYQKGELQVPVAIELVEHLTGTYLIYDNIPEENFNFDKFVTWNRPDSNLAAFIEAVAPYFDYTDREFGFSEFVPKGYSKATGIQYILDRYKLSLDQAHAVGDSGNDLTMLRYVPHSIAMGNSSPKSLFDEVEYVTGDVDKDGIKQALEHYGFI